ncbi:MAG: phosphoribosylaminoimidazolesuccinocarboxamide synthase [Deltaproteobacteria bacterium]|nr:phosphoribosylaminoimidazolesuccinocarboxamide synthase [Deltaproteobacteria bacterium]
MGSVKDLRIIRNPSQEKAGEGIFTFSDRYSVFDWGEMPDLIPDKGMAIAILGAHFFEIAEREGFSTHYIGMESGEKPLRLSELKQPSSAMRVRIFNVIKPPLLPDKTYDYSAYQNVRTNYLIPLEVIYRNRLPEGSSVFKRLKSGEISPEDLGLQSTPEPGITLKNPIYDVSTKLERIDRYIKWDEAERISGLDSHKIRKLKEMIDALNRIITDEFAKLGLVNEDGKIEFALDEKGEICIVDVFGTLDECRFTYEGMPVSKEVARIFYRKTEWYEALNRAKEKDRQNFRQICEKQPENLPGEFKEAIANLYRYCTNKITGRVWFEGVPELRESIGVIKRFIS